jgi:hypothetical protein
MSPMKPMEPMKAPVRWWPEELGEQPNSAGTHALLLAMGKYITYRKEKGELESCADGSDFISRLIKDL